MEGKKEEKKGGREEGKKEGKKKKRKRKKRERESKLIQKWSLTRHWLCQNLDLGPPSLQNREMNV